MKRRHFIFDVSVVPPGTRNALVILSFLGTIVLLADGVAAARGEQPAAARPVFRDFMGINGHTVQFRPGLYQPVASLARDYHPIEWDLGKNSDFVTPFPLARNGVDWRGVYGSWRAQGWRIDVSLMFETIPRAQWKDLAADSRAYGERFARALGTSGQLGLVESAEIGNEPGKFTDGDYRTVFENMARGLRGGDPKLRIATCALTTGKSHDYAKSVSCIVGLEPLYDVLNVHSYALLSGWPTWQRSYPEDPRLKDYLADIHRLCDWRDTNAPGKEVWLTEFGYDASTKQPDPKSDFKQWMGVSDLQQAQWIVRSWLVFSSLPVRRAYLYYFNDEDQPQIHGSSGLTRNFHPKPAFYATAHLQKTLGDYRFSREILDRPGEIMVYEFNNKTDPRRRIWAVWSPTGNHRTTTLGIVLADATIDRAERMPLQAGEPASVVVPADPRQIPVGESPIYLFLREN